MAVKILNDMVAIRPLVFDHDKGQGQKMVAGFYGTDKLAKTLITSEVVFDSHKFKAGEKLYLRADLYNSPQAKMIMKIEDKEFIIIPETMVVAVDRN
jgi:hypothetical protein